MDFRVIVSTSLPAGTCRSICTLAIPQRAVRMMSSTTTPVVFVNSYFLCMQSENGKVGTQQCPPYRRLPGGNHKRKKALQFTAA